MRIFPESPMILVRRSHDFFHTLLHEYLHHEFISGSGSAISIDSMRRRIDELSVQLVDEQNNFEQLQKSYKNAYRERSESVDNMFILLDRMGETGNKIIDAHLHISQEILSLREKIISEEWLVNEAFVRNPSLVNKESRGHEARRLLYEYGQLLDQYHRSNPENLFTNWPTILKSMPRRGGKTRVTLVGLYQVRSSVGKKLDTFAEFIEQHPQILEWAGIDHLPLR